MDQYPSWKEFKERVDKLIEVMGHDPDDPLFEVVFVDYFPATRNNNKIRAEIVPTNAGIKGLSIYNDGKLRL